MPDMVPLFDAQGRFIKHTDSALLKPLTVPGYNDRKVADDREETEPCEAGTPGCCINHNLDHGDCETW